MKILIFHPTFLPPKDYGGVERIVLWMTKGLIDRGHEVTVAAYPGSRLPKGAALLEICPERSSPEILLTTPLPKGLDLIHFFTPPRREVELRLQARFVLTVQGNGQPGERFPKNTVFISRDHAERHGASTFVYNGIDPDEFVFAPSKKTDTYLFLSKTSWRVKNLRGAMRFCREARVPLAVAGGSRPFGLRAQAALTTVIPGASRVHWVGPVAGKAKAELFASAKAFLFPVIWPEPFGIVVAESLMSGTPVLASRRGSLPELVTSDVGAVLDPWNTEEWVELLQKPRLPWDPAVCRQRALERFDYRVMCAGYEAVYRRILAGESLHAADPEAKPWSIG